MNLVIWILIGVTALFAVIGLITGAAKGFTRVKSWAIEYALAGTIGIAVTTHIKSDNAVVSISAAFGVAVALILLLMLFNALVRKYLAKRIDDNNQRYYYKHYEEKESEREEIIAALGNGDDKAYKKLTKRKEKKHDGACGVLNRILGGTVLAVKGIIISAILFSACLTVIDFSRLAAEGGALYEWFGNVYASEFWSGIKNYFFDFWIIGVIMLCIKSGYSSGISSAVWTVVVLGLIVGAGALSFNLAFNVDEFIDVAARLDVHLGEALQGVTPILQTAEITTLQISQIVIGLSLFILLFIVIILIAVFTPKLIDRAREGVIYKSIDGVLGAIILTGIVFGILLLIGAVIKTLYGLEFMNVFDSYFENSGIATWLYKNNPINFELPLRDWLS